MSGLTIDNKLHDTLENLVAQLGTEQDKRSHSKFVNSKHLSCLGNQHELEAMYRTDWASGKIVDIIPDDMTREWREFTADVDESVLKEIKEEEKRIQLRKSVSTAHKWARLYGTSFIILAVDDGKAPHEPLEIDSLKKGCLRHIKVVDRHRFSSADTTVVQDPMDEMFGFPEFYRVNETAIRIHHSRVIRFEGVELPYEEFRRNNYNSDSVLDRLYEALTDLNTVTSGAASMVYETNVDIVKIKGLMGYLTSADGEKLLRKRFALAKQLKSFNGMMLLDQDEDFATQTNTFSGIPDLMDRYLQIISAASDIVATRFLGVSASGFNATGEGDLKNYYDKLASDQEDKYRPKLTYIDRIMAKSLAMEEDNFEFEFCSLFQMTPKEQAELEKSNAERDAVYLDRGVVTGSIIAKELQQNKTYTNITDDYIEELEEFEESDDESEIPGEVKKEGEEGTEADDTEINGSELQK